jgi:glycosyltransferase involved in cell wall biosynthesis
MKMSNKGLSIILCCYNSVNRLHKTLQALSKQNIHSSIATEIILVDNNSTDATSLVSQELWKTFGNSFPLYVVLENEPGLAHARQKGINTASYQYILFCDDDNWLYPNYAQGIYDILDSDTAIAACGGRGNAVFESAEPAWFKHYAEAFATGPQDITKEHGSITCLYGAGIGVNKKHLQQLHACGHQAFFKGRTGKHLSSSEDTELTYAFVLMGYKLVYNEKLCFDHFMPAARMTKQYLLKLFTAFGNDGPLRNLYYSYISKRPLHQKIKHWYFHVGLSIFRCLKYAVVPPKKGGRLIYFKWSLAYIRSLLALKPTYKSLKLNIEKLQPANDVHFANITVSNHQITV